MGLTAPMTRAALLACLLLLTACGFRPLYGEMRSEQNLATVAIENMPGRSGQQLRLLLEDRFYAAVAPAAPQWKLTVTTTNAREDLGIRRDDVATRARLTVTASFTLTRAGETAPVFTGSERSFVSFNIFTDPNATSAAEANALDRGLTQLADLITNRVALYLSGTSSQ